MSQPYEVSDSIVHPSHQAGAFHDSEGMKVIVIKIGTSSLIHQRNQSMNLKNISTLVETICDLKELGHMVVLVTSGGVGLGCSHLGIAKRPSNPITKAAVAAVGTCRLIRMYDDLFALRNVKIGQLLVTRTDLVDRVRFINLRNIMVEMLNNGIVPIVNENDPVAAQTLRFGDNDTLAAYISLGMNAKWLFLLTDVDFLYTSNPRNHPDAKPIVYVETINDVYSVLDKEENEGTSWGSGGMLTKIIAAKLAGACGVCTTLINGEKPHRILEVLSFAAENSIEGLKETKVYRTYGARCRSNSNKSNASSSKKVDNEGKSMLFKAVELELEHDKSETKRCNNEKAGLITIERSYIKNWPYVGTIFGAHPVERGMKDQRRWILSLPVRGRIYIDDGAAKSLLQRKSLFAAGILASEGDFLDGEAVAIYRGLNYYGQEDHCELAIALVSVDSTTVNKIKGMRTKDIVSTFGFTTEEIAHRQNICFLNPVDLMHECT